MIILGGQGLGSHWVGINVWIDCLINSLCTYMMYHFVDPLWNCLVAHSCCCLTMCCGESMKSFYAKYTITNYIKDKSSTNDDNNQRSSVIKPSDISMTPNNSNKHASITNVRSGKQYNRARGNSFVDQEIPDYSKHSTPSHTPIKSNDGDITTMKSITKFSLNNDAKNDVTTNDDNIEEMNTDNIEQIGNTTLTPKFAITPQTSNANFNIIIDMKNSISDNSIRFNSIKNDSIKNELALENQINNHKMDNKSINDMDKTKHKKNDSIPL